MNKSPELKDAHKVPFNFQVFLATLILFVPIVIGCNSILWGHFETQYPDHPYKDTIKYVYLVMDAGALICAFWSSTARSWWTVFVCTGTEVLIGAIMLIHAGAVLHYDGSVAEHTRTMAAAVQAEKELRAAESTTDRAEREDLLKKAAQYKASGQTTMLGIVTSGLKQSIGKQRSNDTIVKAATDFKPNAVLGEWYMENMFNWAPLLACYILISICLVTAKSQMSHEKGKVLQTETVHNTDAQAGAQFAQFQQWQAQQRQVAQAQDAPVEELKATGTDGAPPKLRLVEPKVPTTGKGLRRYLGW